MDARWLIDEMDVSYDKLGGRKMEIHGLVVRNCFVLYKASV